MIPEIAAVFALAFILSLAVFTAGGMSPSEFVFFGLFSLISLFVYLLTARIAASAALSAAASGTAYLAVRRAKSIALQKPIAKKGIVLKKVSDDFCTVWIDGKIYGAFVPENSDYREDTVVKAVITGRAECDIISRERP